MWGRAAIMVVGALPALAGCNTDPMWDLRQEMNDLTTRIDQPEGVSLPDIKIADAREVEVAPVQGG